MIKKPVKKEEWQHARLVEILKYALQEAQRNNYTSIIDILYFDAVELAQELEGEVR